MDKIALIKLISDIGNCFDDVNMRKEADAFDGILTKLALDSYNESETDKWYSDKYGTPNSTSWKDGDEIKLKHHVFGRIENVVSEVDQQWDDEYRQFVNTPRLVIDVSWYYDPKDNVKKYFMANENVGYDGMIIEDIFFDKVDDRYLDVRKKTMYGYAANMIEYTFLGAKSYSDV